ncbi:lipopolysaccharide biosynthesis protein [Paenibacillaceae bacterium]|nr:lipopolysaccharide biosynthesis protein [Paenibacillaceae bacterium]
MELKQYWNIILKKLWLIAILVVAATVGTGIYSYYFVNPQYEASTKLIVNQTSNPSDILSKIDLSTINSNIQLVKSYKEIIKTNRIMDAVASQYPGLGMSAGELIDKVSVSSVNDTLVMSVTARDPSYKQAAEVVNAVSLVFQQEIPNLMSVDNVSILNEADPTKTPAPVSPNPLMNIAVSFALSLLLGLGLALLLEYLDDTVKTEEDVATLLGIPTLSVIPKIKESDLVVDKRQAVESVRRESNVTFES